MTVRRLLLAAVLLGVTAGTALALILHASTEERRPGRASEAVARMSSADVPPTIGDPVHEVRGPVTIAARAPDPGGGPPWAVRLVESRAVIARPRRVAYRSGWRSCAQLGRIVDGQFGWSTQSRGFRPVAATDPDAVPTVCLSQRHLTGRAVASSLISVLRTTRLGDVVPGRTLVFGRTGPDATGSALLDRGRAITGAQNKGAFLIFGPRDPGLRDLRLRISFGHARSLMRDLADVRSSGPVHIGHQDRPTPGRERILARTPDPAGGAPYGIIATTGSRADVWCPAHAARIVGRRPGIVDPDLQIFRASAQGFECPNSTYPLTRKNPLLVSVETTRHSADPSDPGRVQRRSQPGSTVISGRAHPDARTVEISTSRDVRTLQPDPLAGTFITAYDGEFPREDVKITAHFADGTARSLTIPSGG